MTSILSSKFETYLLDEELELEYDNEMEEVPYNEVPHYEEYPPGFFSSL